MVNQAQNIYEDSSVPRISYSEEDVLLFRIGKASCESANIQAQMEQIGNQNSPDYQTLEERLNNTQREYNSASQAFKNMKSKNTKDAQNTESQTAKTPVSYIKNLKLYNIQTDDKEQIKKSNTVYNYSGKVTVLSSINELYTGTRLDIAV